VGEEEFGEGEVDSCYHVSLLGRSVPEVGNGRGGVGGLPEPAPVMMAVLPARESAIVGFLNGEGAPRGGLERFKSYWVEQSPLVDGEGGEEVYRGGDGVGEGVPKDAGMGGRWGNNVAFFLGRRRSESEVEDRRDCVVIVGVVAGVCHCLSASIEV